MQRSWHFLLAAVSLCLSTTAFAGDGFKVRQADTALVDHVYLLNASIDFNLTAKTLNALESGVPLTLRIDIEVVRPRDWWLNTVVASLEQRFQLSYHALSEQYVVKNMNSGAVESYPSLSAAVSSVGTVRGLPLLDQKLLDESEREPYEVKLRASLEIEALPVPLRPLAYLSRSWWLGSDWYTCSLTP